MGNDDMWVEGMAASFAVPILIIKAIGRQNNVSLHDPRVSTTLAAAVWAIGSRILVAMPSIHLPSFGTRETGSRVGEE